MTTPNIPSLSTPTESVPMHRLRRALRAIGVGIRMGWATIVFDVIAPLVVYLTLSDVVGEVPALILSSVPPIIIVAFEAIRDRRVNGVGIIVLYSIGLAVVLGLLSGDAREVVARDAFTGLILAAALLITLVVGKRPLFYYLIRIPGEDFVPGMRKAWARHWEVNPHFRRYIRIMSVMFGGVLIVESSLRILSAYTLPIPVTLGVFQVEGIIVWPLLFIPVVAGFRRAKRLGIEEGIEPDDEPLAPVPSSGSESR